MAVTSLSAETARGMLHGKEASTRNSGKLGQDAEDEVEGCGAEYLRSRWVIFHVKTGSVESAVF